MGVYLVIIAAADVHYQGEYAVYDARWRRSDLCTVAGFMSMLSGELSVATLTLITLDRFIAIGLNFTVKKITSLQMRVMIVCIWVAVLILALVPAFNSSYFEHYYGQSEMCLPVPIASVRQTSVTWERDYNTSLGIAAVPERSNKPNGWEYSVFVFVGINGTSFLAILIMYVWMFVSVKKTRAAARSVPLKQELTRDIAMARKMILIVGTDALCWIPVIGLGIYGLLDNAISLKVSITLINERLLRKVIQQLVTDQNTQIYMYH